MKPKKVKDVCVNLSTWDFEGKLEKIAERVNRLIEQYGADAELSYGQYDRWDDGYSFQLTKMRDETDEEAAARQLQEQEVGQLTKLLAKYQHNPQVYEMLVNLKVNKNET